jgi:hypothetical protein
MDTMADASLYAGWSLVPIWEPSQTLSRAADSRRSHERPTSLTAMPLERQPGPPRVVVDGIEGRDTLYEFVGRAVP